MAADGSTLTLEDLGPVTGEGDAHHHAFAHDDDDGPGDPEFATDMEVDVAPGGGVTKKVTRQGTGWEKPGKGDKVTVHYVGKILNPIANGDGVGGENPDAYGDFSEGSTFDSSRDRGDPFAFDLGMGSVIRGWDLGVATMRKGEVCILKCGAEFAYGARGSPPKIPPGATLHFEVELIDWISIKDVFGDGGVIKTIQEEGEGFDKPDGDDEVLVSYCVKHDGRLLEGVAGNQVEFPLSGGIAMPAIAKVVATMTKGERCTLEVAQASQYGYSDADAERHGVPAGSKLQVDLQLLSWKPVKKLWMGDEDGEGEAIVMKVHNPVDANQRPNDGAAVKVRYTAAVDGKVFEDHSGADDALEFTTDNEQVSPGLDRVVMEMHKGETVTATVPAKYAKFSPEDGVPPNSPVVYEVTLDDFTNRKEAYEMDPSEMMAAAVEYKAKGNAYFKEGNHAMAGRKYGKAVKFLEFDHKYSEDEKREAKAIKVACWNNGAACALKLKDFGGARVLCDKVLGCDSQNIKALYRRAQGFVGTGDYLEAETDLKNALLIDPECKEAKIEMRKVAKLQAQYNKKQAKLYSNMFARMSRMEASENKKDAKLQAQ